jgi:hypothetical protein
MQRKERAWEDDNREMNYFFWMNSTGGERVNWGRRQLGGD